jgi:microcystin-dependent protein
MEGTIGEIRMFGGNFAPRTWALCEGQLLAINSNQALFSILGTTYGGDGRTTFALPDLRGRVAIQQGTGPGMPSYRLGQKGGEAEHILTQQEMPNHTHQAKINISEEDGNTNEANGAILSNSDSVMYNNAQAPDGSLNPSAITIGSIGGSQAHNNMQPFLAVNFIICLQGIFPSRS